MLDPRFPREALSIIRYAKTERVKPLKEPGG
jgi:hypothetical protein